MPCCGKTYTKAVWYHKHIAKEQADHCELEPDVVVVLNHVSNAAVEVPPGNDPVMSEITITARKTTTDEPQMYKKFSKNSDSPSAWTSRAI